MFAYSQKILTRNQPHNIYTAMVGIYKHYSIATSLVTASAADRAFKESIISSYIVLPQEPPLNKGHSFYLNMLMQVLIRHI